MAQHSDQQPQSHGAGNETMRILEALVFASSEPLALNRLKELLPDTTDTRAIRSMVRSINENLQRERHPFEIVEIAGGYQFRTVSYYHPWVQQLFKEKISRRLSIQSLECLAIIAYRQPITKAEIEAVRGVTSDGAMKTLLERHLVTIAGRSEKAGKPLLYATTKHFLNHFGLNSIADLPRIEEFEAMAREKMEELSEEELQHIEELPSAFQEDSQDEESAQEGVRDPAEADDTPSTREAPPPVHPPGHSAEGQDLSDGTPVPGSSLPAQADNEAPVGADEAARNNPGLPTSESAPNAQQAHD